MSFYSSRLRLAVHLCLVVVALLLILVAVLSTGVRISLPFLAEHKHRLESSLESYLGTPVAISELSLSWQGAGPVLLAGGVTIAESTDRRIEVDEVLLDVNLLRSLWQAEPSINELTLVGAELSIEYAGAKGISIQGLTQSESSTNASAPTSGGSGLEGLAWLMRAHRVGLLDTRVRLIDRTTSRQVMLDDFNLRVENQGREHQLRLELKLPNELGTRLEGGIDLTGDIDRPDTLEGSFHLRAEELQPAGWQRLLIRDPSDVKRAPGPTSRSPLRQVRSIDDAYRTSIIEAIRARATADIWGEFDDGELREASAEVALSSIDQFVEGLAPPDGDRAHSTAPRLSFAARFLDRRRGWSLSLEDIVFESPDTGYRIDQIDFQRGAPESDRWSLRASGPAVAAEHVMRWPLALLARAGDARARTAIEARMAAWVSPWRLKIDRRDARTEFDLLARLNDIGVSSVGPWPGVSGIGASIELEDNKGRVIVDGDLASVDWPGHLADTVVIDKLALGLESVELESGRASLSGDLSLVSNGVTVETRVASELRAGVWPHVDLQGRFDVEDLSQVPSLLPIRRQVPGLARWLDDALVGGSARNGEFILFGQLDQFPFKEGEGVSRAGFELENGQLAFLPDWPHGEDMQGRLDIDGLKLTGRASRGRMSRMSVSQAVASIDNVLNPVLRYQATGSGELQSMLDFAVEGPLKAQLGAALESIKGTGKATMDIDLQYPLLARLAGEAPFKVKGSVFLDDNAVTLEGPGIDVEGVSGAVGFDQEGIRIHNLQARFLGSPVRLDGQTIDAGDSQETHFQVQGALDARDLLRHFEIPLQPFASGAAHWHVSLLAPHDAARVKRDGLELVIESDLVGTELYLPIPFYKSSGMVRPVRIRSVVRPDAPKGEWSIVYGEDLDADIRIVDGELESMAVGLGGQRPAGMDGPGLRFEGSLPTLRVDAWVEMLGTLIDELPEGDEPALIPPVGGNIATPNLVMGTESLGPARIRSNSDDTYINAIIDSPKLATSVRYPREHWTQETAAEIRVQHVDLALVEALIDAPPTALALSLDDPEPELLDPRKLPPIEARISSIAWNELRLDGVQLRTVPDPTGLTIETLSFAHEALLMVGEGSWQLLDPQGIDPSLAGRHRTRLSLDISSDDFGRGLTDLGLVNAMAEGAGRVALELSWPGPAYQPALTELDGSLTADLRGGRIVAIEPGAAKLVGLFALQALPRRLNFDFRDVVSDGLAYQKISGDIVLEDGIADARLVQLTGPVGVVDITGTTDLVNQRYNQEITVLPRVSAALPVIAVITGGATAGIGALVAGGFLKALGVDFDRIGLREYRLKGSWETPELIPKSSR